MEHTLEMIDIARRHDVDIAFDIIPHDWAHTLSGSDYAEMGAGWWPVEAVLQAPR